MSDILRFSAFSALTFLFGSKIFSFYSQKIDYKNFSDLCIPKYLLDTNIITPQNMEIPKKFLELDIITSQNISNYYINPSLFEKHKTVFDLLISTFKHY